MATKKDLIVIHNTVTGLEQICVDQKQADAQLRDPDKGWKKGPLPAKKGGDS